jgi:hypothetical protein
MQTEDFTAQNDEGLLASSIILQTKEHYFKLEDFNHIATKYKLTSGLI